MEDKSVYKAELKEPTREELIEALKICRNALKAITILPTTLFVNEADKVLNRVKKSN
jgi:hypothetical protein